MKQVAFRDWGAHITNGKPIGGIMLDDGRVICGVDGVVLNADEVEIVEIFDEWVDISWEILGD